ncbi:hypothetical protein SC206_19130 [Rouxiella sp. T17]|uniref:hypothetical protein n=1 Tax=Rouxiella sp. T17 TaxID=3085684 RepID=UPI002FC63240
MAGITAGWQGQTPREAGQFIIRNGIQFGNAFNKELSNRIRKVSQEMQVELNADIKGGGVAFSGKAIFFTFTRNSNGTADNHIIVKQNQAKYLRYVIDTKYSNIAGQDIVPTSSAKLTQQGNIRSLRTKLASGAYKKVQGNNGKTYLIDTSIKTKASKRNRMLRVIGIVEKKKRKNIFDFYKRAKDKSEAAIQDMRGSFRYTFR